VAPTVDSFEAVSRPAPAACSIAVVIPCFNDGATLAEAVRSVQAQSRIDELVVVDDGSTDAATLEVLGELHRKGVTVVSQPNGGVGGARMTGVRATQADYVFPLDADDCVLPGALAALAHELDRDPALSLIWGDYRLFGDRSYRQQTASSLDPWQISYQNDLPACCLIRRRDLLGVGGWKLRDGYEDWDLWMRLAERGHRGRRLPIVVYEYRQHGVRLAAELAVRYDDIYRVLRQHHPRLFASRRRARRRSPAPLTLKLALPLIFALPIGFNNKRLLGGVACHLANRRGLRLLVRRIAQS
jgi:glycosyltransferase involved in cell wall biosynthesis